MSARLRINMTTPREELIPTRRSLLKRLKNWEDQTSWKDFFDTYWKLIYGVARKAGLTDAEAQDVVQETIICVSRKMPGFDYDPAIGSFKGWLMRLTRWRITDHFRSRQYERAGERHPREELVDAALLDRMVDANGFDVESAWNEEWKKQVFETALGKVRQRANPRQFQVFYLHVCKNIPARQVAQRLDVKLPEVYFAKYKISALLRKQIKLLENRGI